MPHASVRRGYLRNDCVTIAEALQAGGYRTLMSGKWHVGGDFEPREADLWTPGDLTHPTPLQRGFDRFFGTLDGAGSFFNPHYLMQDGQRVYPESSDFYLTDAISNQAVAMIEESVSEEQPFFLYLAYTAPHWPLHALPEDIAKYEGRYRQGWDATRTARHEEMLGMGLLDKQWQISPRDAQAPPWEDAQHREWQELCMAVYAAQIDRMDQGVGQVLESLRRLEVEDNTLVIFFSDNGGCAEFLAEDGWARFYPTRTLDGGEVQLGNLPHLPPGGAETFMSYGLPWANVSNAPFRLYKRWVHEGGISTPLIVQWPALIKEGAKEGSIEHAPCHIIDILPTCLEVAGVPYPTEYGHHPIQPLAGQSLLPLLQQNKYEWQREQPLFWEHQGNCAVRSGEWKLVREFGSDWELYNMYTDRTELHDLSQVNKPMVAQLRKLYDQWAEECGVEDWTVLNRRFQALYEGGGLE